MGGKSTPDAPDYRALAEEQAQSSRQNIEQQNWANRPTQNTPEGQINWDSTPTWDPSTEQYINKWTQNQTLTPEAQASFDSQQRIGQGRSELAEGLLGRAQSEFGQPMDWSQLPEWQGLSQDAGSRQSAEDALYSRATERMDPRFAQEQEAKEVQLMNQGLRPGDEAYDRAMKQFGEYKTDAYRGARDSSIIGGGQEATSDLNRQIAGSGFGNQLRQAQLAETLQQRGFSLNEINAILSGQQINMPAMPAFNKSGLAETTQYSQAGQNQYGASMDAFNADQAAKQGMMSGAAGLALAPTTGGGSLMGGWMGGG